MITLSVLIIAGFIILMSGILKYRNDWSKNVPYGDSITKLALRLKLPPEFIAAIIDKESRFDREAHNASDPSGAWGLFQMLLTTAQMFGFSGEGSDLFVSKIAFLYAEKYFVKIMNYRHTDDLFEIAAAWNGGHGVNIETNTRACAYATDVLERMKKFNYLYGNKNG